MYHLYLKARIPGLLLSMTDRPFPCDTATYSLSTGCPRASFDKLSGNRVLLYMGYSFFSHIVANSLEEGSVYDEHAVPVHGCQRLVRSVAGLAILLPRKIYAVPRQMYPIL